MTKESALFCTMYDTTVLWFVVPRVEYGGPRRTAKLKQSQKCPKILVYKKIVDFSTRGTYVLDLFITNKPDLVNNCELLNGVGDNEAVIIENSLYINKRKHQAKDPLVEQS